MTKDQIDLLSFLAMKKKMTIKYYYFDLFIDFYFRILKMIGALLRYQLISELLKINYTTYYLIRLGNFAMI